MPLLAIGWIPRVGPTSAAVLALSADSATVGKGALLAFLYSLGLGLPYVAAVRRHAPMVMRAGGALLVLIGVLQVSGVWGDWLKAMRGWGSGHGTPL